MSHHLQSRLLSRALPKPFLPLLWQTQLHPALKSVSHHRILCCSVPLHFPAHCWLPLHWKPLFLPAGKVVCPMKPHSFTYSRNPFLYPPDKTLYFLLCTRSDPYSSFYFSTVFGDHEITGLGTHGVLPLLDVAQNLRQNSRAYHSMFLELRWGWTDKGKQSLDPVKIYSLTVGC